MRFFEDFAIGDQIDLGNWPLTRGDVVAFQSSVAPQQSPSSRPHGRAKDPNEVAPLLVACILTRLMGDAFLINSSSMGSPGIESLRWVRPFKIGEPLVGRSTILDIRYSRKRSNVGIVLFCHAALHGNGDIGLEMENPILFGARPAA